MPSLSILFKMEHATRSKTKRGKIQNSKIMFGVETHVADATHFILFRNGCIAFDIGKSK